MKNLECIASFTSLCMMLVVAFALHAETIQVSVAVKPANEKSACGSGTLLFEDAESSNDRAREFHSHEIHIPGEKRVELSAGTWRFSVDADGCWVQEKTLPVGQNHRKTVNLLGWPRTVLKGRIRTNFAATVPDKLSVEFAPSFKEPGGPGPEGRAICPVASNDAFLCRVPGATMDLRISAPGFAPYYKWNVPLPVDKALDVGDVPLIPGASLNGWLVAEDGRALAPNRVEVSLTPHGIAQPSTPSEERLRKTMTTSAIVQDNGFFQFHSLQPGEYLLKVESDTFAEATAEVRVVENRTSEVRHPILLRLPQAVEFIVDPPLDFYQRNWSIEILRVDRYKSHYAKVAEGEVPSTGWFETRGVSLTTHLVRIKDSAGQQVLAKTYDLAQEPMPVTLEIGMVPIEGTIRLGDAPIAARIWFGGKYGAERVAILSDEDGEFGAILPRSGRWRVQVESDDPAVKRRLPRVEVEEWDGADLVSVDLHLPNTKLTGTVQNEDGRPPVGPTLVYAVKGTWDRHVSTRVDSKGGFEFLGLDEGVHQVHAKGAEHRSETVAVALQENEERYVTLTLKEQKLVSGSVVTDDGSPVPGALVTVQGADQPFIPSQQTNADGEGRFESQVSIKSQRVNVTVGSPGRTLGVFQEDANSDEPLLIRLPRQGGDLTVDLPEGGLREIADRTLVVFRAGVPFAESSIQWWASINTEGGGTLSSMKVPNLVSGTYEACLVPYAEYPKWLLGYRDQEACDQGTLSYLGNLSLDLSSVD